MTESLADQIDALLPQTQCTKCGFDGCRPYAEAIVHARAPINRCPPGGRTGIERLARLLDRPVVPLDSRCGEERAHRVAWIDPQVCIGCTKCIAVCPVDAIIGAARRMHTVIGASCSGCDLCVPVCPVDCIEMRADARHPEWTREQGAAARHCHDARRDRLARFVTDHETRLRRKSGAMTDTGDRAHAPGHAGHVPDRGAPDRDAPDGEHTTRKRAVIEAAIRRARERLAQR